MWKNMSNGTTFAPFFEEITLYLHKITRILRHINNNSTRHYGLSVHTYRAQGIS